MDIRTLKTGDPFITLEQFMLLPEDANGEPTRIWGAHMSGPEWIKRYQVAKESWELFGTNPPMDSEVAILVNGFGTTMPSLTDSRRFTMNDLPKQTLREKGGYNEPRSESKYFFVERKTDQWGNVGMRNSSWGLVEKALWWRSLYVLTPEEYLR